MMSTKMIKNQVQPDAVLCASKGGAYMVELWDRMDNGSLYKIPSLMINVHPSCKQLPKNVKVVIVQGSEEEVCSQILKSASYCISYCGSSTAHIEAL